MNAIWTYFRGDQSEILGWLWTTLWLAALPVVVGLAIALPIGWVASRFRWTYPPAITFAGLLYTIPSIVLFLLLPGILHTKILDPINIA
ncbi:MAG: osmoprotectant transport system permease protein, partial [Pseudonocardiales bacterium]|nr:osmoprotectant transport system permease protein [Pseudonocardiales bacterium]